MDASAMLELMNILKGRIYSPEKFVDRKKDELLTDWQVRSLMTAFPRIEYRTTDKGKVIVTVVKGNAS